MPACERCRVEHNASYGSGRFCSVRCARGFSTAHNRSEINERVRQKLQTKLVDPYDDVVFRQAVIVATSWSSLARNLGFPKAGNVHGHLVKRVAALNIDTSHFPKLNKPEDLLCLRPGESKGRLREALVKIGRKLECVFCGNGPTWQGQHLTLQVDHVNGDKYDHRPENLRFLCPNCHSQTDTFCWRNTKRAKANKRRGFAQISLPCIAKELLGQLNYDDAVKAMTTPTVQVTPNRV